MGHEPKISLPEIYLLLVFAIIADLINWIPFINIITTIISIGFFQLYFFMKGVRGLASFSANIMEFIPFLSVFPLITGGVILTIILDRVQTTKTGGKILKMTTAVKNPVKKIT